MATVFRLAFYSAWNRRGTLALMIVSIALSVVLLLGVVQLQAGARMGFSQSVSGTDLIVGPRSSPVQLLLYAVFHLGDASHNMTWSSYEAIAKKPGIAWTIPLSLGDSHAGFPVIGTTEAYFEHFQYGTRQPLVFAAGKPFAGIFDAVLGADVAEDLNYDLNSPLVLSHGLEHHDHADHDDKPFTVVGILARTGTPVDRSIHVSLNALEAIHLDWQGGAQIPGIRIPAAQVKKFNLQPKEITAVLVGLQNRAAVFQLQRAINNFEGEALQAILPSLALNELWGLLAVVEKSLLAIAALVVAVGLSGLVAMVLAGLGERRRELAILRSVGAGPEVIFMLLAIEALLVVICAAVLGTLSLIACIVWAGPYLQSKLGVWVSYAGMTGQAWLLLALVIVCGALVSLIPAYRAYRMSLVDGLTPRV